LTLTGIIKVILFTLHILDPDVMSFRYDPLVGIGIFYIAIKSQMVNRSGVVKWFTVIQQPIQDFNKYTVEGYILITSEHKSCDFVLPVPFNLRVELRSYVGNLNIL
jgi:hypothetical protein